jgi:hypothetical protein
MKKYQDLFAHIYSVQLQFFFFNSDQMLDHGVIHAIPKSMSNIKTSCSITSQLSNKKSELNQSLPSHELYADLTWII